MLAPGRYRGPLILDRDLRVSADGPTGSVTIEALRGPVVSVEGAGQATLAGLVLQGPRVRMGAVVRLYEPMRLTLLDCVVTDGRGEGEGGGGLDVQLGHVRVDRCRFTNNVALQGGAIRVGSTALVQARNTVFAGNRAEGIGGGAVFANRGGIAELCGCTFAANVGDHGSALLAGRGTSGGRIVARSCLFSATQEGLAVAVHGDGKLELHNSLVPTLADSVSAGVHIGDGVVQKRLQLATQGAAFAPMFAIQVQGIGLLADFEPGELDVYGKARASVAVGAVG